MRSQTLVEYICSLERNRIEQEPIFVLNGGRAYGDAPGTSTKFVRLTLSPVSRCGRLDMRGLPEGIDARAGFVRSLLPLPITYSLATNSVGTPRLRRRARLSCARSALLASTSPNSVSRKRRRTRRSLVDAVEKGRAQFLRPCDLVAGLTSPP